MHFDKLTVFLDVVRVIGPETFASSLVWAFRSAQSKENPITLLPSIVSTMTFKFHVLDNHEQIKMVQKSFQFSHRFILWIIRSLTIPVMYFKIQKQT